MLNKSFDVICFHFKIFSEKEAKKKKQNKTKQVLKLAFFECGESDLERSISHYSQIFFFSF